MIFESDHIRVCVPASTSNLGPGFDTLGLALDLCTTVDVVQSDTNTIVVTGEGSDVIPCDQTNLVLRRMRQLGDRFGRALPTVRLQIDNGIPLERGLGSSGAASLAGLLAANALLHLVLDRPQLLDIAYELEGHPDNVTPSLLGGCTVSAIDKGRVTALHVPIADDLVCALCIPDLCIATRDARAVLPSSLSRADAVFNHSRTALLATALVTGRYDALRVAVQDRLHQPYRAAIFPALDPIVDAAHEVGAYGAFLSGAGSTIAALTAPDRASSIAQAMAAVGERHGLRCQTRIATIDRTGARMACNP